MEEFKRDIEEKTNLMKKLRSSGTKRRVTIEPPTRTVSERMRKVRRTNTGIEKKMNELLRTLAVNFEHQPSMFGHPDFIIKDAKIAIFCDSSFWHGRKMQTFKRNAAFWTKKIRDNKKRDKQITRTLRKMGWKVLRFWDDDIGSRPERIAQKVLTTLHGGKNRKLVAVDLFCGAGGVTHGFFLEGIKVKAGFDTDASCKYAYEKNNHAKFINRDILKVDGTTIKECYPSDSIRILVGCAPCQPFSTYSNGREKDDKWKLLYEFARLVRESKPEIVSMENVPQLKTYNGGEMFNYFVNSLRRNGYKVFYDVVKCVDYGVPQKRRRLVLLASRLGRIKLIEKTHPRPISVRNAIGHLGKLNAGQVSSTDLLHRSSRLSKKNLIRLKHTPEGGDWRSWPANLVLECHKKEKGKSFKSVYGRMKWNEPSPTITTECTGIGSGRFGHPEQDRALSIREASLLQSFPSYYKFINPKVDFSGKAIARHIGNAVPVRLGQIIARSIEKHVEDVSRSAEAKHSTQRSSVAPSAPSLYPS